MKVITASLLALLGSFALPTDINIHLSFTIASIQANNTIVLQFNAYGADLPIHFLMWEFLRIGAPKATTLWSGTKTPTSTRVGLRFFDEGQFWDFSAADSKTTNFWVSDSFRASDKWIQSYHIFQPSKYPALNQESYSSFFGSLAFDPDFQLYFLQFALWWGFSIQDLINQYPASSDSSGFNINYSQSSVIAPTVIANAQGTYEPAREGPQCSVKSPLGNICLLWLFVVWGYDVEWAHLSIN